jgi:hypothetical protein
MSDAGEPNRGTEKRAGRVLGPRLWITSLVALTFVISAWVFSHNLIYVQFRSALASISSSFGLGLDADLLLAILLIFVLGVGVMNERLLFASLIFAWLIFVPSVLYFSGLDWAKAFNLTVDFHDMANRLPSYVILLNGVLLVMVGLMLRSYSHVRAVTRNLLERGATHSQVSSATGKNLSFLYRMIAASTLGCLIVAGLVVLIAPVFSALFNGNEAAYMVVSIIIGVILVAALGSYIWLAGTNLARPEEAEAAKGP